MSWQGEEGVGDAMDGSGGGGERSGQASRWHGGEAPGRDGSDNAVTGR